MPDRHHTVSARVHFATGLAVVMAAAGLSYGVNSTSFGKHMAMANLDAWFRLGTVQTDKRIAVVGITGADYSGPVFHRACPLPADGVSQLVYAVAQSGAKVIVVDLDTSGWTADQRSALQQKCAALTQPPQLAWAIGGSEGADGKIELGQLDAQAGCRGVPASIPDNYGVVRGYLPYVPSGGVAVPSLADVAVKLYHGQGCPPEPKTGDALPPVDLIEYTGGPDRFIHLAASVLFGTAQTEAWRNSNPLQGKIVVVGGQFQEARDRYVTPAGYLDGVDILAHAIASAEKGGIPEPSHRTFFLSDLVMGTALVTGSFFIRRLWMLAITFVAIPFLAFLSSFVLYHYTGYFMSFMPILAAVYLHHLVEHAVEHWRLKKEVHELRAAMATKG